MKEFLVNAQRRLAPQFEFAGTVGMKNRREIEAQKNVVEYVLQGWEVFTDELSS